MDEITRKCKEKVRKAKVGINKLQQVFTLEILYEYADDLVIVAKSEMYTQINVNTWNKNITEFEMNVNNEETELLVISQEQGTHVLKSITRL